MGKLINGINGPFLGKVGTASGSSWKGIPYIKGPYKKRTGKASKEEKGNRNKFAMAQRWLQPALSFVRQGFKNYSPTVDGFLAAKSWLLLHSFEGTQPDISINPALVKLSHGSLPLPANIRVEKINGSQLVVSAEDLDFANEGHESLVCSYVGEDMEIGFNSKFLVEMVSNLESDEITIEMSAPNRAGIIVPSQKANPGEDVLMLVMPVMLNN